MSTVIEAIAAAHAGLPVLGFSAIANAATGGPEQAPDSIEEVLAHGRGRRRDHRGAAGADAPRLVSRRRRGRRSP